MNYLTIFLGTIEMPQMLLILAVVLLLFGGKKIPELMKGLGSGVKEFKNAAKDDQPANSKKEETTN
ncbi:twin-arginine translocase TatA/TatE family subunit [Flavobacterium sp.]|uniref:twin-arginine translocase TatA/TatE family subunit n=1 Tax=Flavobacterium sp. TaxID=239 RepID=UPI003752ECA6